MTHNGSTARSILFVTAVRHPLFDTLTENLRVSGVPVDRLVLRPSLGKSSIRRVLSSACRALKVLLSPDGRKHADLSLHFVGLDTLSFVLAAFVLRKRVHLHFWGSDIAKFNQLPLRLQKFVLRSVTTVTFATETMRSAVPALDSAFDDKTFILPFGLELLPLIDEAREAPPTGRGNGPVIVCGTNSSDNQQLLEMIPHLEEFARDRMDALFVFPLNYGDEHYRAAVSARLASGTLRYEVVERFLTGRELAKFRADSTVLVQLQKHDALSAAMLETLYAGGRVITGTWLPYDILRSRGVDWIEVHGLGELPQALARALSEPVDVARNRELVGTLFNWEVAGAAWARALTRDVARQAAT